MGDLEAVAGQAQSASGRLIILYHIPVLYQKSLWPVAVLSWACGRVVDLIQ